MREIKFRGKRIDNGEWVYGHYIYVGRSGDDLGHRICSPNYWDMFKIDPATLGQFTGLYDKNGKEIYEGDVLKCTSTLKQWERELFDEIIGKVTIKIGMTYLVGKCKHGYLDEELKISNYKALLLSPDLFEVIGDTHNNPELLESEVN